MFRSAFLRDFLRTIARTPGRFLALLAIVALGAGFYAGLRMTAPAMDRALDAYLDRTGSYDIRIVSTLGLTDEDLSAISDLEGVGEVIGADTCDGEAELDGTGYAMRFHSLSEDTPIFTLDSKDLIAQEDSKDGPCGLVLVDGRMPQTESECVIGADSILDTPFAIGDSLRVERDSLRGTPLATEDFTVVGLIRSPFYVSPVSLGATAIGTGQLKQYVYVIPGAFEDDGVFSEAYVTVKGASELPFESASYDEAIDRVMERLETLAPQREQARLDGLRHDALESLREELISQGLPDAVVDAMMDSKAVTEEVEESLPDSCEWALLDRSKNVGIASFTSDAERVDSIAQVFPFVFFLVAALVALTTMTRMVDEERLLVGTYKALGYGRSTIALKYLGYGFLAAGIGAALGIVILSQVLPAVIMEAYTIMYWVPPAGIPLDWPIVGLSWGLSVAITLIATAAATGSELRAAPAMLLRPPAPKKGKRILLEHIGPLWRRLSFSWKVTFRNIFRYGKRAIMTLIGIAGCTALLLTGFGLHDALGDIIDIHFNEVVHYSTTVSVDDEGPEEALDEVKTVLVEEGIDDSSQVAVRDEMRLALPDSGSDIRLHLVVPEDPETLAHLFTLRDRRSGEGLSLEGDGVVITEKLGNDLGLEVGDPITFYEQDAMGNATGPGDTFIIDGLAEAYVDAFAFVSPSGFEEVTGSLPTYNSIIADVPADEGLRDSITDALSAVDGVATVAFNDETIETYRTMLQSVDLVVLVLVISAAALAFIVLYNLTNINIEERIREIATLKVLGFTRRETWAYIFREVALLALVGALIGLAIGIPLEQFVVSTAEVDRVMFGRTIHQVSFIAAFALTLLFTALSLGLMMPKLSRIDMVASLKSTE